MKILFGALLLSSAVFANNNFKENVDYTCINSYVLKNDKRKDIDPKMAKDRPFDFIIKEGKLVSTEGTTFQFMLEKDTMKSYANAEFMLLLNKDMKLAMVPKQQNGKLQVYFKCKQK